MGCHGVWHMYIRGCLCNSEGESTHISILLYLPAYLLFIPAKTIFLVSPYIFSQVVLVGGQEAMKVTMPTTKAGKIEAHFIHFIFEKEYIMSKEYLDLSNFTLKEKGANYLYLHVHCHVKQVDCRRHGNFCGNLIFMVTRNHKN